MRTRIFASPENKAREEGRSNDIVGTTGGMQVGIDVDFTIPAALCDTIRNEWIIEYEIIIGDRLEDRTRLRGPVDPFIFSADDTPEGTPLDGLLFIYPDDWPRHHSNSFAIFGLVSSY